MGANCGKVEEKGRNAGISSSTAAEMSAKRQATRDVKNLGMNAGVEDDIGKENRNSANNIEKEEIKRQKTKALRGKALLAACSFDDEDEDGDEKDSFPQMPGLVSEESPISTARKRVGAALTMLESPGGTRRGSQRSKKFLVDDVSSGAKGKALRGKALLMACQGVDEDWSDDD